MKLGNIKLAENDKAGISEELLRHIEKDNRGETKKHKFEDFATEEDRKIAEEVLTTAISDKDLFG